MIKIYKFSSISSKLQICDSVINLDKEIVSKIEGLRVERAE